MTGKSNLFRQTVRRKSFSSFLVLSVLASQSFGNLPLRAETELFPVNDTLVKKLAHSRPKQAWEFKPSAVFPGTQPPSAVRLPDPAHRIFPTRNPSSMKVAEPVAPPHTESRNISPEPADLKATPAPQNATATPEKSPFSYQHSVALAQGIKSVPIASAYPAPKPSAQNTSSGNPLARAIRPHPKDAGLLMQQLDESKSDTPPAAADNSASTALKGSITTLKVTRGRSQIIKFAQPITRLSIAEPTLAEIIPLSPDQIMINGKQRGVTSLIVWDEHGQEGIFDLQIQNDTSELLDAVNAIAPNEKIDARITDDSFILSGQLSNSIILDEIRRVASAYGYRDNRFIDLTETPSPQVVLDVKIAEASRNVIKDLKTSFNNQRGDLTLTRLGTLPAAVPLANGTTPPSTVTLIPASPNLVDARFRNQASNNVGGIIGAITPYRAVHIEAAFDMLETKGKITILAEPTLVCTHGRTASFLAGGEFPFTSGTDQNGSPLISFKEFGVKLNFTPWIAVRSDRIELKVEPEVSSVDRASCIAGQGGQLVCGLLRRTTSTTVDMKDGESLMISGIIQREEANTFQQVPFIGSVPILGSMFKNANFNKTERELVVVITPRIVKDTDYGKIKYHPG